MRVYYLAILLLLSLCLGVDPHLCEQDYSCSYVNITVSKLNYIEIDFNVFFTEADYFAGLDAPDESTLNNRVCAWAKIHLSTVNCMASFDVKTKTLTGKIMLFEPFYLFSIKSIGINEIHYALSHTPITAGIFSPDISVYWFEKVKIHGKTFSYEFNVPNKVEDTLILKADTEVFNDATIITSNALKRGDLLYIDVIYEPPNIIADKCIVTLRKNKNIFYRRIHSQCEDIRTAIDFDVEGIVKLETHLLRYRGDELIISAMTEDLFIESSKTRSSLNFASMPANKVFFLGDNLDFSVRSQEKSFCNVTLINERGNIAYYKHNDVCQEATYLISSSNLESGPHILLANISSSLYDESVGENILFSLERHFSSDLMSVSKNSFSPGETVRASFVGISDNMICTGELFDTTDISVKTYSEKQPCAHFSISLPADLQQGRYKIAVFLWENEMFLTTFNKTIEVLKPSVYDALFLLCRNGVFYISPSYRIPCIKEGDICHPSDKDLPYCLCSNSVRKITPQHVCRIGSQCTPIGCTEGNMAEVTLEEKRCQFYAGRINSACITPGEICSKLSCTCMGLEGDARGVCAFGQLCGNNGCLYPQFNSRILFISPRYYTSDDISQGKIISVAAKFSYDERWIVDEYNPPVAQMFMRETELKGVNFTHVGEGTWLFNYHISGSVLPGIYNLFLTFSYGGEVRNFLEEFEIWHSKNASQLTLDIATPLTIETDYQEMKAGMTKRIVMKIIDDFGNELKDLPLNAFSATLDNREMDITLAKYDDQNRVWLLDVLLQASVPELIGNYDENTGYNDVKLTVSVNHLGYKGKGTIDGVRLYKIPRPILKIISIGPEDYLYQLQTVLGFNLYVDIEMKKLSSAGLSMHSLVLELYNSYGTTKEGKELGRETQRFPFFAMAKVPIPDGIRVYLRGLSFCEPPIFAEKYIGLNISIEGSQLWDFRKIIVKHNPSFFLYPKGAESKGCNASSESVYRMGFVGKPYFSRNLVKIKVKSELEKWQPNSTIYLTYSKEAELSPQIRACDLPEGGQQYICEFRNLNLDKDDYFMTFFTEFNNTLILKSTEQVEIP